MNATQMAAALSTLQREMQQQKADSAQALHTMQQQMTQQLAAELAQQQQQLQQQYAQQLSSSSSSSSSSAPGGKHTPPPPRAPTVRIALPSFFEGRVGSLDEWVSSMVQQFDYYDYFTDAARIKLAAATMGGSAREWYQVLAISNAVPTTWADLVAELRTRFQPIDNAIAARGKLLALKQGTSSAADYVSSFRRLLVAVPDMGASDRLFQFTRGLNAPIASMLRVHGVTTLADAEVMAVRSVVVSAADIVIVGSSRRWQQSHGSR
jgi:hypothetical protein